MKACSRARAPDGDPDPVHEGAAGVEAPVVITESCSGIESRGQSAASHRRASSEEEVMKKPERGSIDRWGFLKGPLRLAFSARALAVRGVVATLARPGGFAAARLGGIARAPASRLMPVPLAALLLVLLPSTTA